MRSTFKILFYLKRNAPKKNGLVPVMCRITVNGKIASSVRVTPESLALSGKNRSFEVGRLEERGRIEAVEIGGRGVGVQNTRSHRSNPRQDRNRRTDNANNSRR